MPLRDDLGRPSPNHKPGHDEGFWWATGLGLVCVVALGVLLCWFFHG